MGSICSFERWVCKSAIAYTEGRAVRYGLFGSETLARLAALPRLRWVRLEDFAPLSVSYQSIMGREERAVVAMSAQLRLHDRRVFDYELTLSNRRCDLLILVCSTLASPISDRESPRDVRGDAASVLPGAMFHRSEGRTWGHGTNQTGSSRSFPSIPCP